MIKPTLLSNCTVQTSDGGTCNAPEKNGMPFPICSEHAVALWRHVNRQMGALVGDAGSVKQGLPLRGDSLKKVGRKVDDSGSSKSVVYYLRIGAFIKVGTTSDLKRRINAYPPDCTLLALERGGTGLETYRINQFTHLNAARREWFHPGEELLEHINNLRRQVGKETLAA